MLSRRRFTQAFAVGAVGTSLTACSSTSTTPRGRPMATSGDRLRAGAGKNTLLGPIKQVNAGLLSVGYVEYGPANDPAVVLIHGWPYDVYSYADVGPLLAAAGYRVIVPYLRGYGPTTFLSRDTVRNGQQSVFALDITALMEALRINKAILGGFDWGARTADIIAALWPQRCKALL